MENKNNQIQTQQKNVVDIIDAFDGSMSSVMFLILFEEFLDKNDFYLTKGWKNAEVVAKPKDDKYTVTFAIESEPEAGIDNLIRFNHEKLAVIEGFKRGDRVLARMTVSKKDLLDIEATRLEAAKKEIGVLKEDRDMWLICNSLGEIVLADHDLERIRQRANENKLLTETMKGEYSLVHNNGLYITEGVEYGDFEEVALPVVSLDEYLPVDPTSDNFVFAFFFNEHFPEAASDWMSFLAKFDWMTNISNNPLDRYDDTIAVYGEVALPEITPKRALIIISSFANGLGMDKKDLSFSIPSLKEYVPYHPVLLSKFIESRIEKTKFDVSEWNAVMLDQNERVEK